MAKQSSSSHTQADQNKQAPLRPRQIRPKTNLPTSEYVKEIIATTAKQEAEGSTDKIPFGCLGTIFGTILFLVIIIASPRTFLGDKPLQLLLLIVVCVVVAKLVMKAVRQSICEGKLQGITADRLRAQQITQEKDEDQATQILATKVEGIHNEQNANLAELNNLLWNTKIALDRARQLFSERAYTPFWDSIEDAVELLRKFDRHVMHINESAKIYYASLDGREHTFPPFPLRGSELPKPNELLKTLAESIAVAQRDFQFAQIFEQRRTTSAIVTGFRNTQEAISSLRNDLVNSLSDLQRSLEDGLADVSSSVRDGFSDMAERHERSASDLRETLDRHAQDASTRGAKHEEFVEGALDNIQNKRKPRLSETKEPFRPS